MALKCRIPKLPKNDCHPAKIALLLLVLLLCLMAVSYIYHPEIVAALSPDGK